MIFERSTKTIQWRKGQFSQQMILGKLNNTHPKKRSWTFNFSVSLKMSVINKNLIKRQKNLLYLTSG